MSRIILCRTSEPDLATICQDVERQEEVEQEETGAKVAKVRPWGGTHKNGNESIPIGPFSVSSYTSYFGVSYRGTRLLTQMRDSFFWPLKKTLGELWTVKSARWQPVNSSSFCGWMYTHCIRGYTTSHRNIWKHPEPPWNPDCNWHWNCWNLPEPLMDQIDGPEAWKGHPGPRQQNSGGWVWHSIALRKWWCCTQTCRPHPPNMFVVLTCFYQALTWGAQVWSIPQFLPKSNSRTFWCLGVWGKMPSWAIDQHFTITPMEKCQVGQSTNISWGLFDLHRSHFFTARKVEQTCADVTLRLRFLCGFEICKDQMVDVPIRPSHEQTFLRQINKDISITTSPFSCFVFGYFSGKDPTALVDHFIFASVVWIHFHVHMNNT